MTADAHSAILRAGRRLTGPANEHRWGPLQVVAWIATRDQRWVEGVTVALFEAHRSYSGDPPEIALQVSKSLRDDLHLASRPPAILPFGQAVTLLVDALATQPVVVFANGEPLSVRNLKVVGLTYSGGLAGLDVLDSDGERWTSVQFDAQQIIGAFPRHRDHPEHSVVLTIPGEDRDAEARRIAALFDAEGKAVRVVTAGIVAEHWSTGCGKPSKKMVTSFMKGGKGGRPGKDKTV